MRKLVALKFDGYINKNMHVCNQKLNIRYQWKSDNVGNNGIPL